MKIAVIDYSMLRHIATAAVKKFQDENAVEGHLKCITRKMSEILYSLKTIENIDVMAFAMDSKPYWRQAEMESFYKRETKFSTCWDDLYWEAYGCIYKNDDGKPKKITKKELKELELVPSENEFDVDAENFPLPRYKGNRSPIDYSWLDCGAEKYFEFIAALPHLYAKLMKGLVISSEGAEADDIAAVVVEKAKAKGNEVILITGDGDWKQLSAYHDNVEFYNPFMKQRHTFADREEILEYTLAKIIGGDSGDGITGCARAADEKGLVPWGPVGQATKDNYPNGPAWSIVKEKDWARIDRRYLDHNKRMVRLHTDTIPFDIVAGIEQEIGKQVKSSQDVTWGQVTER